MFTIQPFEPTDNDYEAIVSVENVVWPDEPMTVEVFKYSDRSRDPNYLFQRLVVKAGERIVAFGHYEENAWSHQPGKYHLALAVHPDYERQGIGAAFYEYAMNRLAERQLKPTLITTETREDKPQAIRFLEKRGFERVMRWPQSRLDVTAFDPAKFAGVAQRVQEQDIQIYTVSELQAVDPDWQHKLHELDWACTLDEPLPDPPTKLTLEQYVKDILDHPNFMPEAWFIALDGSQYVGLTALFKNPRNKERLDSGFTGVLRSHRRRGIATALKLRAIDFARQYGAKIIKTGNEENNPMYSLNLALGFKPGPAWLAFKKIMERRNLDNGE